MTHPGLKDGSLRLMMVTVLVMFHAAARIQVFLGVLFERRLAARRAEVVGLTFVFVRRSGCLFINFHIAYRIDCHVISPFGWLVSG